MSRLVPLVLVVAALTGCTGTIGETEAPIQTDACAGQRVAVSPAARLTASQYRATVATLLPGVTLPSVVLPADQVFGGFDNNIDAQIISSVVVDAYQRAAESISAAAAADLSQVVGCAPASGAEETACIDRFIDRFASKAFRAPIDADQHARLAGLFANVRSIEPFPSAARAVIEGVLQSPSFLYRIEHGVAEGDRVRLSGFEIATKLAYFLGDAPPDDVLSAAADNGELDTVDGIAEHTLRLLDTPQARAVVASFHRQWLMFDKMQNLQKDAATYPGFNDDVSAAMRSSAEAFVEKMFWDNGELKDLVTSSSAPVNAALAPIFGLDPAAFGADLTWAQTNGAQRSGILTHPGLMAGFAHSISDAPVQRGVFVLDRFLCAPPPPAPANVNIALADAPAGGAQTTRARLEQSHAVGACQSCHTTIDGIGFSFEHYDAIGAWREKENGTPVDATGELFGTDVDGPFDGAVSLGAKLAASTQVQECVASEWYRYAVGASRNTAETCAVAPIAKAFADNGGNFQSLLVAITTSDAFRYRGTGGL